MIIFNSVSKDVGKGSLQRSILTDVDWVIPAKARIVVLGHRGAGKSVLLGLMSGLATPTKGWIERRAVVSLPGGVLRYARGETPRMLIMRMSAVYGVDPQQVVNFISLFKPIKEILDIRLRRLRGAIRAQLSVALSYAFPCDYYLFDGNFAPGRDHAFRQFCTEAFALRSLHAGTILTTNSTKYARGIGYEAAGAVLFRSKLYLYKSLPAAIAEFEKLPVDEPPPDYRSLDILEEDEGEGEF